MMVYTIQFSSWTYEAILHDVEKYFNTWSSLKYMIFKI